MFVLGRETSVNNYYKKPLTLVPQVYFLSFPTLKWQKVLLTRAKESRSHLGLIAIKNTEMKLEGWTLSIVLVWVTCGTQKKSVHLKQTN